MVQESMPDINYPKSVILDPSLLTLSGQELLSALMEEQELTFKATPQMLKIIRNDDKLTQLLEIWGEYPGLIKYSIEQFNENISLSKINTPESPQYLYDEIRATLEPEIKYYITKHRDIASFLSNEIALALYTGDPIMCVLSNPEIKIVEFMKRIGCKIKGIVEIQTEQKTKFFKTKDFKKLAIASSLQAAFVFIMGGSAFLSLGCAGIAVIVYADP